MRTFERVSGLVAATMVGIVIGIAIRYPTGWRLEPDTAALFGACAGSIFAVAGAVIVWQIQEDSAARNLGLSLRKLFDQIFVTATDLKLSLGKVVALPAIYQDDINGLAANLETYAEVIHLCRERTKWFNRSLGRLKSKQLEAFIDLDWQLGILEDETNAFVKKWRKYPIHAKAKGISSSLVAGVTRIRDLLDGLTTERTAALTNNARVLFDDEIEIDSGAAKTEVTEEQD